MSFTITQVKCEAFPSHEVVEQELMPFGLSITEVKGYFEKFVCQADLFETRGYQQSLACELPLYLKHKLVDGKRLNVKSNGYTTRLNERADLVITCENLNKSIYFEFEFRPNVEKDLIKFQIGQNAQTLAIGVLVVALAWKEINSKYYTMPEYTKVISLVKELDPKYPLIVIGITGSHNAVPVAV